MLRMNSIIQLWVCTDLQQSCHMCYNIPQAKKKRKITKITLNVIQNSIAGSITTSNIEQ